MFVYEPLNTLKPVAEDVWIVDGPVVHMAICGISIPFPTRMSVIRLSNGELFLHSPTALVDSLQSELARLGPVRHLVSPNKVHYASIAAWKAAYPDAHAWASPGVRERAASQNVSATFDHHLGSEPEPAWAADLDQLVFRGSRFMEEVVFLHRKSHTLLLADLIVNFEPHRLNRLQGLLFRLSGAMDPEGQTPLDLRVTFVGHKREARECFQRMAAWKPERIIVAHGRWYPADGERELHRAFRGLGGREGVSAR